MAQLQGKIRLLWHSVYMGGPIQGLCLYEGKKYPFARTEAEYTASYIYLYKVSEEQLEALEKKHAETVEQIGYVNDYGENFRNRGPSKSASGIIKSYPFNEYTEFIGYVLYNQIENPYQYN